ncbi:MAG: LOG family protein [Planctomycetes bacterium]|nr:LOG family protein [Planctomycetota bacterium]
MSIASEWQAILADLEKGFSLLKRLPPAVTFFGGARITPDDPIYEAAREVGRRFARAGIPPRTGAGPGIMTGVPEGYRAALAEPSSEVPLGAFSQGVAEGFEAECVAGRVDPSRTQGIKIYLPFEPETNEAIDESVELLTFPIRRLMLYENSLALVCFPGGFGTVDELFEVWARRAADLHRDPIIFMGEAFWTPLLRALRAVLAEGPRKLVAPDVLDEVVVSDDPERVLEAVTRAQGLVGFDEDPEVIARRLALEIPYVAGALGVTPNAVTVLGAPTLAEDDPTLDVAEVVLGALARTEVPVRVGTGGVLSRCALEVFRALGRAERLQGFFLAPGAGKARKDELPPAWTDRPHFEVTDPIAHKLLLSRRTSAFLALPGDLHTLETVFSVLCEIQTGKLARRPIALLGADYWGPIMEACAQVMLSSERRTISPEDLELFRIVDTAEDALAVLSGV